ncbi:MAG: hypothetical protein D6690_04580 [Nitrospirae bacterium]|nr:MAG: hypothetical protein D6690_04580 [Nitrospirota bacterium]
MVYELPTASTTSFKLLPAYTGITSMDDVLRCPRAARLLWLEILINDRLELEPWRHLPSVQAAFAKACRWYTAYRTVLTATLSRTPLPHDPGPIDCRDYRTFAEVLRFVTAQS